MREQSERRRGRLGNIAAGYLAAVVVADVILCGVLGFVLALREPRPNDIMGAVLVGMVVAVPITIVLTLLPAAAIIWQVERQPVRSWAFYAGAGALTNMMVLGIPLALLVRQDYQRSNAPSLPPLEIIAFGQMFLVLFFVLVLPGLCAGLVYWRVAGRNAGRETRAMSASGSTTV